MTSQVERYDATGGGEVRHLTRIDMTVSVSPMDQYQRIAHTACVVVGKEDAFRRLFAQSIRSVASRAVSSPSAIASATHSIWAALSCGKIGMASILLADSSATGKAPA